MSRGSISRAFVFILALLCILGCGQGGGITLNAEELKAKAGLSQNVIAGNTVALDGSQSTGAADNLITYQWSIIVKPVGSAATINNPTAVNPTLKTDLPGEYSVKLIITDTKSNTSEDSITVTAISSGNVAPVANAGIAQNVITGTLVTLDGSKSSGGDGAFLTYSWAFTSRPAGSGATLSNATVAKPTFIADVAGRYTLDLIVNNGNANSAAATVTVNAATIPVTADILSAISVSPLDVTVGVGQGNQFYATGIFAAGGSKEITSLVNWVSSNTAVATIDNKGLATAVGQGTTIISAAMAGKSSSTNLTVGPAALVGVRVDKGSAFVIPIGQTLQLTMTATYADRTKKDITELASWTAAFASFRTNCLAVSDEPGSKGLVRTSGQACYEPVWVSYGGMRSTVGISVK